MLRRCLWRDPGRALIAQAPPDRPGNRCSYRLLLFVAVFLWGNPPLIGSAEPGDGSDAQEARLDAILAMPSADTTAPLTSLYATSPGLEEQLRTSQWRLNLVATGGYNSNGDELATGGTATTQFSPVGYLSWATPLGSLPLRLAVSGFAEGDRYVRISDSNRDRAGLISRLQYVNANNDQALSPYIAYAPRWTFLPAFSELLEGRQDLNIGFNKTFNFDSRLRRVPFSGDSSAATTLSFGLTVFGQRRWREPAVSSDAFVVVPSITYEVSQNWSVSVATEFLGRWYEKQGSESSWREFDVLPIGTLEYAIPSSLLGGERIASLLGQPTLDLQASYLRELSDASNASYQQWNALVGVKSGWSF
jgi:hypothetical protein